MKPGGSRRSGFSAPAYAGDFPDPSVLSDGELYWAYGTGSGGTDLQVMSSPDLSSWTAPTEALGGLASWASRGFTWAPAVERIGDRYVMYYSVRHAALGVQAVSVATSPRPGGPFVDETSEATVVQVDHGGSIDARPFADPASGRLVLVWKSDDNSLGRPSHIWARELTPDGLAFAAGTSPTELLSASAFWQFPTVEGPALVLDGDTYYLFYAANSYTSASSGIGYATSKSLLGRYRDRSSSGPWMAGSGNAQGPQGPMVFVDRSASLRLAFAAWYGQVGYRRGGRRALWFAGLRFSDDGRPEIVEAPGPGSVGENPPDG